MYKIPRGGSPARFRAAGPGPARAFRGRAGLPPPGRCLVFCIDLEYICIYLEICGYIFGVNNTMTVQQNTFPSICFINLDKLVLSISFRDYD